jgi:hypothetical protein
MHNADMLIDFISIQKRGAFVCYEVAPGKQRQNQGSFIICSTANADFEPPPAVTGVINGAALTLLVNGKASAHRLRMGNKSINQLRLWQLGYHIPDTVVLDFNVAEAFKRQGKIDLRALYDPLITSRLGEWVAVRCSSNLEDSEIRSFAGTFDTFLDIPNRPGEIQEKIDQSYQKFCFRSESAGDKVPYDVRLSIMIQQMIPARLSGFLFTLDPVNPPSDWLKIEYWQGPRERSEGHSITLNRTTGKRVSSGRDSSRAPLPAIQARLYQAAIELEQHLNIAQDVEFLISGADDLLYLVQSRPITAFCYSPDKVRLDEQQKLAGILADNRRLYHLDAALSNTNISELFTRAIPLSYSIFRYGFAGSPRLEGGISIGRSRLGYARLDSNDRANLFYTVADQARTNLIVDALTFRLPGISKREYLDIFVRRYLEQIRDDPAAANYPEDGLYLQSADPARWQEIAGARAEAWRAEFVLFFQQVIQVHAPAEVRNAGKFFQQNGRRYRSCLNLNLHAISPESLRNEIDSLLTYLRTRFCPQYVVYARLAFLCTHAAKLRLNKLLEPERRFTAEQVLNWLLPGVAIPAELAEPQYLEFERLLKLGRVSLSEFLNRFEHLGSLDITQPRLGEYSISKLSEVFGQENGYGFDSEFAGPGEKDPGGMDLAGLRLDDDPEFRLLYTYAGQFMRLREKAKSELLKLLWALKRLFVEFARLHHFGDLIYYLELDEALALGPEQRETLRMIALQRKAYLDACQQHRVKNVLVDLQATPFEEKPLYDAQDAPSRYRFEPGKTIFHARAEGFCLTASNNEEFSRKLADYRAKKIENIVGVFKGVDLSYFNVSALAGFATESGGYLSHAATIAREFRLPYITGIGFDHFQDEDYIILDTEHEQVIIRR